MRSGPFLIRREILAEASLDQRREVVIHPGARVTPHERTTADRLADVGFFVELLPIVNGHRRKNIDARVDGELWEFKGPSGGGGSTISNQFRRAKMQGAVRLVLDLDRIALDESAAMGEAERRFVGASWLTDLICIRRDRRTLRIHKW